MRFEVEFNGHLVINTDYGQTRLPSPEELETIIGRVADELAKIDAQDPALATDAADGGVEISVAVLAADPAEAVHVGNGFIRGAVHAAGIGTPGWSIAWMKIHADLSTEESDASKEFVGT